MFAILSAQITSTTSSLSFFWINALIISDLLPQSFHRGPVRSAGCDFTREIYLKYQKFATPLFSLTCVGLFICLFFIPLLSLWAITQVAITRQKKKRAVVKVLRMSKQHSSKTIHPSDRNFEHSVSQRWYPCYAEPRENCTKPINYKKRYYNFN